VIPPSWEIRESVGLLLESRKKEARVRVWPWNWKVWFGTVLMVILSAQGFPGSLS